MRISHYHAESNVGRKRRHNEDAYVSAPPVFAVADGMGGAQAGEVASGLAAETVRESDHDPAAGGEERVVALIKTANLRVHERAAADAAASGMGTTMTVALLQADGTVAIGHVGDSRAYRFRDGLLEQLTDDHSLVAELVRRGELSPEEAAVHPQRSVITRALGTESDVDVDAFTVEARDGDLFLLCSDGLTTMVDAGTIAKILDRHRSRLDAAATALIKAANDRGGDDNITAILFAVAEDEPGTDGGEPPQPAAAGADPADEETLHPADGVRLPELSQPPAELTMVVSAEEVAKALEADPQAVAAAPADEPGDPPTTTAAGEQLVAGDSRPPDPAAGEQPEQGDSRPPDPAAGEQPEQGDSRPPDPAAGEQPEPSDPEPPEGALPPHTDSSGESPSASPGRIALALLVIAALATAIVLLVVWALPR